MLLLNSRDQAQEPTGLSTFTPTRRRQGIQASDHQVHSDFPQAPIRRHGPFKHHTSPPAVSSVIVSDDVASHSLSRSLAGGTVLSIAYGIQVQDENDPYLEMSRLALQTLNSAAVPGAFLVDSFPFLKHVPAWFPGASFKRKAREWRKAARGMLELPYVETKKRFVGVFSLSKETYTNQRHPGIRNSYPFSGFSMSPEDRRRDRRRRFH